VLYGKDKDYKQEVYWYKKAADQGFANAQYNLGVAYDKGQGVLQDGKKAVYWYKKAEEKGVTGNDKYDSSSIYKAGIIKGTGALFWIVFILLITLIYQFVRKKFYGQ